MDKQFVIRDLDKIKIPIRVILSGFNTYVFFFSKEYLSDTLFDDFRCFITIGYTDIVDTWC